MHVFNNTRVPVDLGCLMIHQGLEIMDLGGEANDEGGEIFSVLIGREEGGNEVVRVFVEVGVGRELPERGEVQSVHDGLSILGG